MVKRILKRMAGLLVRRLFPKLRANRIPTISVHPEPTVDLVTTWNTHCGIAAYSAFLAAELKNRVRIRVVSVTGNHTLSPYFFVLGFTTGISNSIVHVQFAYGMFARFKLGRWELPSFTAMLFYFGLAFSQSPVITTFHEVMKTMNTGGKVGRLYAKLLNRLICDVSDLIIVHNSESKELIVKNYKVNKSKLKVIPMGCVEKPQFLNKDECKEKLGLSGKTVLTIPGFISKNHGHDLIVSILPRLDKNVHLLIAGGARTKETAAYYKDLREMARRYRCIERITFVDDFPITATILNATDIAILSYRYATESLTLRLLAAYKVPTITSDLIAFKEIKKEYDCIELFRSDDKEALLARILFLLSDERRQGLLQKHCQKLWNDNKWSSIAAKHKETYLEVLAGHPDSIYDDENQKERIDWLRENVSGSALEIGCAGGYVTSYTRADVGLDINQWRIKFAKTKHPEKDFITASAFSLPFKEKAFDTILIPEILEHVPLTQAERIISEAKRVASKILITLPNAEKINYNKSIVESPEHKWFPTKKIILNLMKNCSIQYTSENDFILVYWT